MNNKDIPARGKQLFLAQRLRGEIQRGVYAPGERLRTQGELAKRYGVSAVTIQRTLDVLAREGFVRARGRLGTFVAEQPPHLNRYGLVFIDQPDYIYNRWNRFHAALATAAADLSRDASCRIVPYYGVSGYADNENDAQLLADLQGGRLSGLVFAAHPYHLQASPLLTTPGMPRIAVMTEPEIPGLARLFPDVEAWVDRALEHVVARGRRRVAVLATRGMYSHAVGHLTRAMAARGLDLNACWCQIVDYLPPEAARNAVHLLFRPGQTDPPDALLVMDDNLVEGACAGLLAAGAAVPGAVEVVGYCNYPNVPVVPLAVTQLGFDAGELLLTALGALVRQREGERQAAPLQVPPRLAPECAGPAAAARRLGAVAAIGGPVAAHNRVPRGVPTRESQVNGTAGRPARRKST